MSFKHPLFAAGILLSAASFNAHALTTTYNANGVDLVYSSISDLTWTADGNLLGSMMNSQGYSTIVNAIIAANPGYTFTASTFNDNPAEYGRASWIGAMAFTNYLNSIDYAGSNQWRLPSPGTPPSVGYFPTGSEFGQLFFSELGGKVDNSMPDTNNFINEQFDTYWLNTENSLSGAYVFYTFEGFGGYQDVNNKQVRQYAWAVTPEQISAVPVPAAAWLFGPALLSCFSGFKRRRHVG